MLNQSAFTIVLSCNYCDTSTQVKLSEMCLCTEHAHEWQIVHHISCIPGSGDPESFGGGGVGRGIAQTYCVVGWPYCIEVTNRRL